MRSIARDTRKPFLVGMSERKFIINDKRWASVALSYGVTSVACATYCRSTFGAVANRKASYHDESVFFRNLMRIIGAIVPRRAMPKNHRLEGSPVTC